MQSLVLITIFNIVFKFLCNTVSNIVFNIVLTIVFNEVLEVNQSLSLIAVVEQDVTVRAEGDTAYVSGAALLKCVIPTHLRSHVSPIGWETDSKTVYPSTRPRKLCHFLFPNFLMLVQGVEVIISAGTSSQHSLHILTSSKTYIKKVLSLLNVCWISMFLIRCLALLLSFIEFNTVKYTVITVRTEVPGKNYKIIYC